MPFELPAELPAVPRVDEAAARARPAVEPPVPSVLEVLLPLLPVPAALPPVPRLLLVLPLPAVLPPVPRVLAEPGPLLPPAALPPVRTSACSPLPLPASPPPAPHVPFRAVAALAARCAAARTERGAARATA